MLQRPVSWTELLELADRGEPAAVRLMTDAGHGLGRLVAAVANLAMPDRIVITGEGVDLARIAGQALDEGIRADRDARAGALDVGQMSTAPTDADCTSLTYFASTPRV